MGAGRKLLMGAAVAATLIGCWEITARVVGVAECRGVEPDPGSWEEMLGSTERLWEMRPNHEIPSPVGPPTRINAIGLREELLPASHGGPAKRPGEVRILTTGDSTIYGWGVPTGMTYQERLEAMLERRFPNAAFEVINLGVPGYSTVQSISLLRDYGWDYDADIIVVSNIFSDSNFDTFKDEEALALVNPDFSGSGVLRRSRTYCALYMAKANMAAREGQQPNRVLMPGTPRDARWVVEPERFGVDARVPLESFKRNLEVIRTEAEARGVEMVLAPLAQEWDAGRWSMREVPQPDPGTPLPWSPYREAVREFAAAHQLLHVPYYEAFAGSGVNAGRLFSDAIHPTPQGAEIMARTLFESLVASPTLQELAAR